MSFWTKWTMSALLFVLFVPDFDRVLCSLSRKQGRLPGHGCCPQRRWRARSVISMCVQLHFRLLFCHGQTLFFQKCAVLQHHRSSKIFVGKSVTKWVKWNPTEEGSAPAAPAGPDGRGWKARGSPAHCGPLSPYVGPELVLANLQVLMEQDFKSRWCYGDQF